MGRLKFLYELKQNNKQPNVLSPKEDSYNVHKD